MTTHSRAQLQIHACVLLWGFTPILGKLISLPAWPLVGWRMVIVSAALFATARVRRGVGAMAPRARRAFAGVGCVVAIHWVTFYGAIKLANASVAATCLALTPVFVALVEPALTNKRFDPRELLFAGATVPGVALVVGGTPSGMHVGVAVGVVSSFCAAVFGALNKRLVHGGDALSVTAIEIGTGALLVALLAPLVPHSGPAFPVPSARDALLLSTLALGCTLVPFSLSLVALRELSAFDTSLALTLEPVYAVVAAALLLHEQHELSGGFYGGVAVLLAVVAGHSILARPQPAPSS
jgi:drug/metabolite transporter (DMT)-like permease